MRTSYQAVPCRSTFHGVLPHPNTLTRSTCTTWYTNMVTQTCLHVVMDDVAVLQPQMSLFQTVALQDAHHWSHDRLPRCCESLAHHRMRFCNRIAPNATHLHGLAPTYRNQSLWSHLVDNAGNFSDWNLSWWLAWRKSYIHASLSYGTTRNAPNANPQEGAKRKDSQGDIWLRN